VEIMGFYGRTPVYFAASYEFTKWFEGSKEGQEDHGVSLAQGQV
jgi:hypothetical protein